MDARTAFIVRFVEQCATLFIHYTTFPCPFPSPRPLSVPFCFLGAQPFHIHTALDPTKLNKPRQFSRSTAPAKVVDNTLWTETPAEKQQRLADEVMGKKRRVENADPEQEDEMENDAHKRRKREAELQRQVDEYTVRPLSPVSSGNKATKRKDLILMPRTTE